MLLYLLKVIYRGRRGAKGQGGTADATDISSIPTRGNELFSFLRSGKSELFLFYAPSPEFLFAGYTVNFKKENKYAKNINLMGKGPLRSAIRHMPSKGINSKWIIIL